MLKAIFISVRTGSTRLPNKSILKIKAENERNPMSTEGGNYKECKKK